LVFPLLRNLAAQTPTGGLNGVVTDPSGGVIAKAAIRLVNTSGASIDTTTNRDGFYEFKGFGPRHIHPESCLKRLCTLNAGKMSKFWPNKLNS